MIFKQFNNFINLLFEFNCVSFLKYVNVFLIPLDTFLIHCDCADDPILLTDNAESIDGLCVFRNSFLSR